MFPKNSNKYTAKSCTPSFPFLLVVVTHLLVLEVNKRDTKFSGIGIFLTYSWKFFLITKKQQQQKGFYVSYFPLYKRYNKNTNAMTKKLANPTYLFFLEKIYDTVLNGIMASFLYCYLLTYHSSNYMTTIMKRSKELIMKLNNRKKLEIVNAILIN